MADSGPRERFDDWFDEPEPADSWTRRVDRVVRAREEPGRELDDWIERKAGAPPPRGRRARRPATAVLALAGLALCLLFGILAAAGVFSSGARPRALSTPSTTAVRTTPATTTAAAPTTVPVPVSPLKPGDTGPAVAELQRALAHAGYPTGKVDGDYGPATKAAVERFQAANGLTADGIAGPKTLAALGGA